MLSQGWLPTNENIEDIKVSKTTAAPTIIKYNAVTLKESFF